MQLILALALVGQVDVKEVISRELTGLPSEESAVKLISLIMKSGNKDDEGEAILATVEKGIFGLYLRCYSGRYRFGTASSKYVPIFFTFDRGWKIDRFSKEKKWEKMEEIDGVFTCLRMTFQIPVDSDKNVMRAVAKDFHISSITTGDSNDRREGRTSFTSLTPLRPRMEFIVGNKDTEGVIQFPAEAFENRR